MKSCVLCRKKIPITTKICDDCKIIKSFIQLYGKETLLNIIKNYRYAPQLPVHSSI